MPIGWRWPRTRTGRVLARVVFYSLALFGVLPFALSGMLISPPPRQPVERPPSDAREAFFSSDGLRLRGWVFEGDPLRPAFVFVHGLGDSLESFEGSARRFHKRGHSVLPFDLRGHGGSAGRFTTLGGFERDDVLAAMAFLRDGGLARNGFVLSGVSMGSVAALRAAAGRDDVRAVIAEAPFDSFRGTARHHGHLFFHLPDWLPLIPLTVAVAEWRAGFDADDVDAVAAAGRVKAPLLAIADGADPRMPEAVVRRVFDAHLGPKQLWIVPDASHAGASLHPDYWPTVFGFLEANGLSAP
jgi:pimeloyl-ACP methyl ester carboxylesterase